MGQETIQSLGEEALRQAQVLKNQAALALLRSWDAEPEDEEQVQILKNLKGAIDAARPGRLKHFS